MPRLCSALLISVLLLVPLSAHAIDEETRQLEAYALCHAQPYRCPPGALMTPEERATDTLCEQLTPHRALITAKMRHREPLDSADLAAQQTWQTSCHGWEQQRRTRQPQASPPAAAFSIPSAPTSILQCWTETWGTGMTSGSRTTCTSY